MSSQVDTSTSAPVKLVVQASDTIIDLNHLHWMLDRPSPLVVSP